jgi:MFS family permease
MASKVLASSSLVWNMYSLLTPIRYVLNPRFELTSPLQSGLFYIAPGCGYLFGTFFGGRWADHIVKKWIGIRGERVPEDRLRSCLVSMGVIIPACMLIYGWSVEKRVGGIALPVIMMFLQGVAQLFCFPSLNTYCLDVMQGRSAEVVGKSPLYFSIFERFVANFKCSWQLHGSIHVCRRWHSRLSSCRTEDWRGMVLYHLSSVPRCCYACNVCHYAQRQGLARSCGREEG